MKTKLLRKVRRRYDILKYTAIGTNPTDFLKSCEKTHGLPFYVVADSKSTDKVVSCKTLEEAKSLLSLWIVVDYLHKVRRCKVKSENVWY